MKKHMQKVQRKQLAAFGALSVAAGSAAAAIPQEASDAFSTLSTDALGMVALGWPIVAIVVGGLALISIFKKVIARAT